MASYGSANAVSQRKPLFVGKEGTLFGGMNEAISEDQTEARYANGRL
jgi:hypothetical protein